MDTIKKSRKNRWFKGFTLSELLVSLTVLGVIAGLAVPKVVLSVQKSKVRNNAKEAIQTISSVSQQVYLEGQVQEIIGDGTRGDRTVPTSAYVSWFRNTFQGTFCENGNTAELCGHASPWGSDFDNAARVVTPTGALIVSVPYGWLGASWLGFWVDADGAKSGNQTQYWGDVNTPPGGTLVLCNMMDTPQDRGNGFMLKSGMCGPWDGGSWMDWYNAYLGVQ
jgi:prepilin-type N-terminal cleavage/methylation domain-containing protein